MYEIIETIYGNCIKYTTDDSELFIPFIEENSDYQQYLLDTDGGLPLP